MRKTVQVSETWGAEQTTRPWSSVPTTDDRCEMCGAAKTPDSSTGSSDHTTAALLWRLAEINKGSPMVLQVLLRRVLHMAGGRDGTLESIADEALMARETAATMTRQAVYEQCKAASKKWPELRYFLNPDA